MTLYYRIVDSFSQGQTLVGEMQLPAGTNTILEALRRYSMDNPEVFW